VTKARDKALEGVLGDPTEMIPWAFSWTVHGMGTVGTGHRYWQYISVPTLPLLVATDGFGSFFGPEGGWPAWVPWFPTSRYHPSRTRQVRPRAAGSHP